MHLALFFLKVSIVNTFVIFDILNNTSGLTTVLLIYPASVPYYKKKYADDVTFPGSRVVGLPTTPVSRAWNGTSLTWEVRTTPRRSPPRRKRSTSPARRQSQVMSRSAGKYTFGIENSLLDVS